MAERLSALPWRPTPEGLSVTVRLTPRGGRDALDGIEHLADGRPILRARVRAAPADNQANTALVRLLADCADVSASQVRITGGAAARIKTVLLAGDADVFAKILASTLERLSA